MKPDTYSLWTGDKTPELALFYNIALERLKRFLKREANFDLFKPDSPDKTDLWKSVAANSFTRRLKDKDYLRLKNLLWKGFLEDKNRSGTGITDKEKRRICALIVQLDGIRNFQSHFYHSNHPLLFSADLKSFVQELFDEIRSGLQTDYPMESRWFEENWKEAVKRKKRSGSEYGYIFNKHDGDWFLNRDGKAFFLSLFLTTGEMKLFLKQRKGTKRDDGKDFQYKHALYTALCHRDGAARFHYNQEDSFLETNPEASEDIRRMRQFFKINTYLNDLPPELFDARLFPFPGGEGEIDIEHLQRVLKDRGLFSDITFLAKIPQPPKLPRAGGKPATSPSVSPLVPPLPMAYFQHTAYPELYFSINRKTLEGIVLEGLRGNSGTISSAILAFAEERKRLVEFITKGVFPPDVEGDALQEWLESYPNFRIRNQSDSFRFQLSRWIVCKGMGKAVEPMLLRSLFNKLRYEPIELKLLDFFQGENRKPRQKDEFMAFGLQYLIDFKVFPKLNVQWQCFETITNREGKAVLTEISCFQPEQPRRREGASSGWRLKLTEDNQILFSWGVSTEPIEPGSSRNTNQNLPLFLMGHRVLKNLLIGHFLKKKTNDIVAFFDRLAVEVNQLYEGQEATFELLTDKYIPLSLNKHKREQARFAFKRRLSTRLDFLICQYSQYLDKPLPTRHERNKAILDAYRLFDWPKRLDGTEIHLRKDEVQWMSILHYELHKSPKPWYLLDRIRGEMPNRICPEVMDFIKESKSLDDLYIRTLSAAKERLQNWKAQVEAVKGSKLKDLAQKVGLSIYEGDAPSRRLPFDVHPELFVKGVFRAEFEKNPRFNVSDSIMKNPQYPQGIRIEYYKDCLEEIPADPKTKNKRYGALSPLTTKDQLLFLIGKKYNPLYLQVKDLFSETMRLLPLPDSSMKQPNGLFEIAGKQVEVRVAYHQLDDFMVLLTAHETKKLAWHYLIFEEFLTEGGSWSNIPEVQKENKEIPEISSRDQETISLSLGALRKAKDRLFAQNLMALKAIQDFEKATIEAFKATLTSDPLPTDQSDWISFSQVLQLAGITDSEAIYTLNHKIRTVVLHARIPDEWTFNGPMFQESIFGPSYRDMEAVKGEKRARYARFSPDIKAFGNK